MATDTTHELSQVVSQGRTSLTQPGVPTEQFEIQEEENVQTETIYPKGWKLWSTMASLCIACFLSGLVSIGSFLVVHYSISFRWLHCVS